MRASEYSTWMVHPRRPRRQPDAHGATSETEHPMLVAILGVLVIAHGLVTTAIWVLPAGKDAPFDASHSWLLGDVRAVSVALGVFVGPRSWPPVSACLGTSGGGPVRRSSPGSPVSC
jgi:hypothetical protein